MFREEEIYNDNEDGFREEEDEETNDDGLFISEELNNEQSTLEIQSTGVPLSIAQELAFMPDEDEEEGLSLGLRTEDAQTLRTLVTCPKCRELMENPYSLSCLHRFCFRCLPTEKCFVCMRAIGPTEKPFPDQAYETIVASLFPHHCFYCGQTDGASVETHRKHCTALEECPHRGCQERLYPHEKVAHVETCCHRPATCFGCKRPFSVGKLKHHEQVCPELVSCCGELVRSEDLARRHARKLGIVVRDQNRQHAEFVPCKRFKLAHKCDTCGSIHGVHESCVVACPYCKEMFSADYMPTHKLLCLEASITCQSCEDQFPGSPLAKMNRKSGQAHHDVFHKLGTPFVVPVNVCAISPLLECLLLGKMPTHLPCPSYAYNKSHCVYKRHACSTYVSNAGLTPLLEASPYILARDCSKIAFALFKTEETARSFRIDVFECSTMNSILPQDACNSESFDLYDFERRPGEFSIYLFPSNSIFFFA